MVKLCFMEYFKGQVLQWYGAVLPMKEPSGLLGKTDSKSRKMRKVVMQTSETLSNRIVNKIKLKHIVSTYVKADLEQVASNTTQLNYYETTQLQGLINDF